MGKLEIIDDGWEEQAEGVKAGEYGEVAGRREPDLKVEDTAANFGPSEFFLVVGAQSLLISRSCQKVGL